ncbi:ThiF family protein [gamma proteobacterium HTCC5015]|nr:ThiF family protein [gamma proteobacterium HTCC5015]
MLDSEIASFDADRFGGIARLYGVRGAERLARAHVAVVGIGGVGSWAAEALVRSGVGTVTLIDLDDICITNSNRQIHALQHTVGQPKIRVMAERLKAINPACIVHEEHRFLTDKTVRDLIHKDMDYVIDAIDSAGHKARLISWCKYLKIGVVTTGAAGGQIDPTKIVITDLNRTTNDPLAAKVRGILRRHHGFSTNPKRHFSVPCVHSKEQMRYPQPDGSVCQSKSAMREGVRLDCAGGFGASTMVTATVGFAAAAKAVEKLVS